MFDCTNLISDVDQETQMFVLMKCPLLIDVSSPSTYKSRYKKKIKYQYIQLNKGAKVI